VNSTKGRLLFGLAAGHQSKNNLNDKQVIGSVHIDKGEQGRLIENFILGPK
jgi:hypothetical protein